MVRVIASLLGALVVLGGCGGGGSHQKLSPQAQARAYATGVEALRGGDYELASDSFRDAGSYRDSRQRLAEALRLGAQSMLSQGRAKLAQGAPRAAVVFAQLAATEFGDHGPAQQELLRRAQAAQELHHRQQIQAQQAHKAPPPAPRG